MEFQFKTHQLRRLYRQVRTRSITIFLAVMLVVGVWGLSLPAWAEVTPLDDQALNQLFDQALEATQQGDFVTAENRWTQLLEQQPTNPALWSNRGNSRVSQNNLEGAIADYNNAVEIAPEQPDPYLNRGVAEEGLGQWDAAIADYNQVLKIDTEDPLAYNNRGNAKAGLADWDGAIADYRQATELAPDFSFARANYALALYQVGETDKAIEKMRGLVLKYPKFADMRAALTAALWSEGLTGEAESNWASAVGLDGRYQDLDWVTQVRRWPPSMVDALQNFLTLQVHP